MEITDRVDLSTWPAGSRVIVRRERPHPGAQLSFTDHDGYRFQAILTDQTDPNIAVLERCHRQRARVEDRIRDDKDTNSGLAQIAPSVAFGPGVRILAAGPAHIRLYSDSMRYGHRSSNLPE